MHSATNRNGVTTLETIIALPVFLIAILAIVELGYLSSNQMIVQAASRAGADAAAALGCDLPTEGDVPTEIVTAVSSVLECKEAVASCIRVEHTLGDSPPYVLNYGSGAEPPAASPPTTRDYVCVSVCVENSELAPNLLRTFCIDLAGTYSQKSVCRCASCDKEEAESFSILVEAESDEATKSTGGPDPNGWNLWSNGTICFDATVPVDGTYTFCSRLWASRGGPELANAAFLVDGAQVGDFFIAPTSFGAAQVYCVDVFLTAGSHELCIAFTNDFYDPPIDRNLFIDWMSLDGPN